MKSHFVANVRREVTMKYPVSGSSRRPFYLHRAANLYELHVLERLEMIGDHGVRSFTATVSYAKIKTVEMKRMLDSSCIDESPVNGITLGQRQPVIVRPRFAVEYERTLERLGAIGISMEPLG